MVRLTFTLRKQQRSFIDSLRISVRGGRGGNGLPSCGGVGGKGGDVYLEADNKYTLKKLQFLFPTRRFAADAGEDSKRFCALGNPGKDLYIRCPPGVSAVTDQKIVIGEVNRAGDKVLLCQGGCGGGPENGYIGQKGQHLPLVLNLKLLADVGFVGFPNAGKSTLLQALSRAKPKIASYPFTTIQPEVGTIYYQDYRKITVADLPGLIEGSHLNLGKGHKFLKHCLRTKVLLFVVDINGFRLNPSTPHRNAVENIALLNRELELYDEDLLSKPAILAVNKLDVDGDGTKFEAFKEGLKNISSLSEKLPLGMFPKSLIKFDAIVPISALHKTNIPELKDKIRAIIDVYQQEEENKQKRISVHKSPDYDVIYA